MINLLSNLEEKSSGIQCHDTSCAPNSGELDAFESLYAQVPRVEKIFLLFFFSMLKHGNNDNMLPPFHKDGKVSNQNHFFPGIKWLKMNESKQSFKFIF